MPTCVCACAYVCVRVRARAACRYTHATGHKAGVAKDIITLETLDVREKLAASFALAQSVKLGVFERTVEQTIQETRPSA